VTAAKPSKRAATEDDPLAESAKTFATARDAQAAAQQALADATRALKAARAAMADEIVKAAKAGVPQREIHRRTGDIWTRENIRKVCIAAGVDLSRK